MEIFKSFVNCAAGLDKIKRQLEIHQEGAKMETLITDYDLILRYDFAPAEWLLRK